VTESTMGATGAEAWLQTADGVLCGLNHALSNRIAAIGAVDAAVADGHDVGHVSPAAVSPSIGRELERIDRLLRLYRLLESADGAPAEPARIADALPDAVRLFQHHLAVRDVPCAVESALDLSPVLLPPAALTQALLVLMCAAARRAANTSPNGGIVLRCGGDADWVVVAVETRGLAKVLNEAEPRELGAARWLLRHGAVTVDTAPTPGGGLRVSMRVETLATARRRERGA
jgi:hypothetical protein